MRLKQPAESRDLEAEAAPLPMPRVIVLDEYLAELGDE